MKNKFLLIFITLSVFLLALVCLTACETDQPPVNQETTANELPTAETTVLAPAPSDSVEPETAAPILDGSFSTPDYSVNVINGVCYLTFAEETVGEEESSHNGDGMIGADQPFLAFSSISEMKQAFRENQLTEKQRRIIQTRFTLTDKGYEICNLDQMLCPAAPQGFATEAVYLLGLDYYFALRGEGETAAAVYLGDSGRYDRKYNEIMEIISNHRLDSHTTETYDGVECESYVISTTVAQAKFLFMTLPAEGEATPTRVIMRFSLQSQNLPDKVSDTVPLAVYVYGEEEGMPFEYLIQGVSFAPTVEWLSSFSIAPYEDVPPAAAS
jgi:hypothetical protein